MFSVRTLLASSSPKREGRRNGRGGVTGRASHRSLENTHSQKTLGQKSECKNMDDKQCDINKYQKNKTIYHHYLYLQKPDQIWHDGHLWKRNKTDQNPTFQQKTTIELKRASTLEEARNSSISCIANVSWLCKALDVPNLSDICPTWKQLEL